MPHLDVSPVLEPDEASYDQSLEGVMTWMIKTGQIDINTKVSILSSHSAMPRQGHLETVFHIIGYLNMSNNTRLAFDPFYTDIDHINFWHCD